VVVGRQRCAERGDLPSARCLGRFGERVPASHSSPAYLLLALIPFLMKRVPIEVKTHGRFACRVGTMPALAKGRCAFESVICQFWSISSG